MFQPFVPAMRQECREFLAPSVLRAVEREDESPFLRSGDLGRLVVRPRGCDVVPMTSAHCARCGAERPSWLGAPHRCIGNADLSWLSFHEMSASAAMAWRRHVLDGAP